MPIAKRLDFNDLYLEDALPVLEEVLMDEFERLPKMHEKLFRVESSDRGIAQYTRASGIPSVPKVAEAAEFTQDKSYQGESVTISIDKYGIAMPVSQEAIDDGQVDLFTRRPQQMSDALMDTIERTTANHYNNATITNLSDGKSLLATDHPIVHPLSDVASSSNKLAVAADLSITSLKDGLTLFQQARDMSGKRLRARPSVLLVPLELEHDAHELVKSELLPGGNNNNINSVSRFGLEVMAWQYLTDADQWFLQDPSRSEMRFIWRKRPATRSYMEEKSEVGVVQLSSRWGSGVVDWRFIAGSEGAA